MREITAEWEEQKLGQRRSSVSRERTPGEQLQTALCGAGQREIGTLTVSSSNPRCQAQQRTGVELTW